MSGAVAMDPSGGKLAPGARLSCELCSQRKKRCDKLNPCSYCQRQGAVCKPVVRPRLPRGKHRVSKDGPSAESDSDLRARVARLEWLLRCREQEEGGVGLNKSPLRSIEKSAPSPAASGNAENGPRASEADRKKRNQYIGGSFWNDVMGQNIDCSRNPLKSENHILSSVLLSPADSDGMSSSGIHDPSSFTVQRSLVEVFLSRIDPVFKIIHQPSLRAYLLEGKQYLDYERGHHAPNTLASAIYYAAVCILNDQECNLLFQEPKSAVVARYRRVCDVALFRADFMTTNDLTVLQAFMISLLSYRLLDQGRRVWTMLSMALRVGQALFLHIVNPPFEIRPLEMELRRRVWHAIGILDAQSSLDRATEPMIIPAWLEQNTPSNINDGDIGFFTDEPPLENGGFTDMTFNLLVLKAHKTMRTLNFSRWTQHGVMDMEDRQTLVIEFQKEAIRLVSGCSPDTSPLQWLAVKTAECLIASLQLVALRPLQRDPDFTPPQVKNHGLLKLCIDILQRTQQLSDDPHVAPWRWFQELWAPWHPLSVALAEICVCDDLSVMETYWPVVEHSFHVVGPAVADSKEGMLWKPIDKLMKQAESKREFLMKIPQQQQHLHSASQITQTSQPQDVQMSAVSDTPSAADKSLPAIEVNGQSTEGFVPSNDIWDLLNFEDWTEDLGQNSWSSFTSFLDELYEADDSILTFG
ncbi:hypothetical protein P170DRAFT_426246 [Aspergillus steynii IBT 23096]|uniref:Zn(2)-C6 fungal-type domain-containing protein n=1 Tax=Aspergillus steynii IBT 23096 TaxID=1392250 RepID=A0A2I2G8U6_9EURO|nr:uncharacterized protein P170DRAFT_426246 [Aspergillus steynii IBT 23096]PLB49307.1 hypothetical protein P170DRAFT_426246 [Aspergillus steynii IBT 23096]